MWRPLPEQHQKWQNLLNELTKAYNIGEIKLLVNAKCEYPQGDPFTRAIILDKYSMISFLHEFGHFIGIDHPATFDWSEETFYKAMPSARKRLVRDEKGYLVKK